MNLFIFIVTCQPAVWRSIENESFALIVFLYFNCFTLPKIWSLLGVLHVFYDPANSEMDQGLSFDWILRLFVHQVLGGLWTLIILNLLLTWAIFDKILVEGDDIALDIVIGGVFFL
jgi:hypothetical protein